MIIALLGGVGVGVVVGDGVGSMQRYRLTNIDIILTLKVFILR